jgi:2-pyrone-4,6-dicarboxylate lactonase
MSTEATTGTPTKRRHAPPPVRDLRPPKLKLPPGACDTHFHFLGPQREFPFNPNRNFVPDVDHDDSTIADWQQMQSALGLSRGLLLQSMMYCPSYELALHALCLMPKRLRAVVSPRAEITDGELEILTEAGVVGVRFTRATSPTIDDRLVHRTHELGWGMHYLLHDEDQMRGWRSQILKSPDKFVIEHLGNPPVEQGVNSGTFKFVLECIDTGRCWVKLSPRPSKQETFPFSDVLPLVKQLVDCHWHHARFDLRSGSTFDLWADDVPARAVRVVEREIWVAAAPAPRAEAAHWRRRLHDGRRRQAYRPRSSCVMPCSTAQPIAIAGASGSPRS